MDVRIDPSRLRQHQWHEYAIRLVFGGAVATLTGFLARTYGPAVGGLFLGFPAVLPASLTLIKKHDGLEAAANDAMGAIAGSGGMIAFALVVWGLAPRVAPWLVLLGALVVWLVVSIILWLQLRRFAGDWSASDSGERRRPAPGREQGGAHSTRAT